MFLCVTCIEIVTLPAELTLENSLPTAFEMSSGSSMNRPEPSLKLPKNSAHLFCSIGLNIRMLF